MIDYIEIDDRIRIQNPQELLKCDVVVHVNSFCEIGFKHFKDDFTLAHETGQEIIPIVIDSFGGDPFALLGMADLISASEKIVATVVIGKAMSCGAILLTCGHEGYRFASPRSTIMIHDLGISAEHYDAKSEEIRTLSENMFGMNKKVFEMMDKNCGLEKGTLLNILRSEYGSAEWYLTAHQAKKLNIVNHVRVPKLITRVKVESKLV